MRKVLVVEDSGFFASVLKNNLNSLNYEVDSVKSITEARKMLEENEYHLMTLDVNLPDGNGYEFCNEIKRDKRFYKIQVAIITSDYGEDAKIKAFNAGALAFFSKNDDKQGLANFISDLDRLINSIDNKKGNVLIVEKEDSGNLFLKGLLEYAELDVSDFVDFEGAIKYISEFDPKIDLFIVDFSVDNEKCKKFINFLSAVRKYEQVPIMVLANGEDSTQKYDLFLLGVSDYMEKPFDVGEFFLRVKMHLRLKHTMDMLSAMNKRLEIAVHTDDLTELYNRKFFWQIALKEENRFKRYKSIYSVIMIDIDDFKKINDTYGHGVGDTVLKNIAESMKQSIRDADVVARFGGEEFIILLPETKLEGAVKVAEKVRRIIENLKISEIKGNITISLGVACRNEVDSLDDLIKLADERLYKAKGEGKNRVVDR